MPLSDDLVKPPTQPGSTKKPAEQQPGPNGEGAPQEDPQAFIFSRDRFPDGAAVKQWLLDNGYEEGDAQVMEGQEGDEPHVAILFEADLCEPDTAYREEVEEGVEVVACVKKDEADSQDEEDRPGGDASSEEMAAKAAAKGQPANGLADAVPPEETEDDAAKPSPEDEDEEEEDKPKKPYGAEVLEAAHGQLCSVYCELEEALKILDNPKVLKYAQKLMDSIGSLKEEIEGVAAQHYPDHFEGKGADDDASGNQDGEPGGGMTESQDEEEDKQEEEDEPAKPGKKKPLSGVAASIKPRKKAALARKDLGLLQEAGGFLEELASEDNLKRSQKAACRLHARELGELTSKYSQSEQTALEAAPKAAPKAALIETLEAEYQRLQAEFYSYTGVEL